MPRHSFSEDALLTLEIENELSNAVALPDAVYPIKGIRVLRQNIFLEPKAWLYRQANRLHRQTRERVVRSLIPFAAGDAVDGAEILEGERALRAAPFIGEALILVNSLCADGIFLDVIVRDVWTIWPRLDLVRTGGDNEAAIGFSDLNWRGTGKNVEFAIEQDEEGAGVELRLADPRLADGSWRRKLVIAEHEDGSDYEISVARPFRAFKATSAAGFSARVAEFEQDNEFLGDDIVRFDKRLERASAYFARSTGKRAASTHRFYFGAAYQRERIDVADAPIQLGPIPDRKFAYPYVAWQYLEDLFVKTKDVYRVGVPEDISVGLNAQLELGWSPESVSGADYLLARGTVGKSWLVLGTDLLAVAARLSGNYRLDGHSTENLLVELDLAYLHQQAPRWRGYARVQTRFARNLYVDNQLTLGADTGLRGYPSNYQLGDRSWLFTYEERYLPEVFPFKLFRLGFVAFLDVGRAWFADDAPSYLPERRGDHLQTIGNVGLGLRLESVRTRRDRVLHLDLAHPLVDGPNVGDLELTFRVRQRL